MNKFLVMDFIVNRFATGLCSAAPAEQFQAVFKYNSTKSCSLFYDALLNVIKHCFCEKIPV